MTGRGDEEGDAFQAAGVDDLQQDVVGVAVLRFRGKIVQRQQVPVADLGQIVAPAVAGKAGQLAEDGQQAGKQAAVALIGEGVDDLRRGVAFAGTGAAVQQQSRPLRPEPGKVFHVVAGVAGEFRVFHVVVGKVPVAHDLRAQRLAAFFPPYDFLYA